MTRTRLAPALLCLAVLSCAKLWAQTNRRPAAPPAAAQGNCTVADFRMLALSIHDPKERSDKALEWLRVNGSACTPAQLVMIMSNRPTWMGTGDSHQLSTGIERLLEIKSGKDPAALESLYSPVVQSPVRRTEAASAAPAPPAAGAPPTPPAGGLPGGPATDSAVASALGAQAGTSAMAVAPGGQNVSINLAPPPPEVDMSRKMPLPTEPWFSFPPELGTPLLNYFGKIRRQFVKSFYMETLTPGKCPEGMAWRNDRCEPSFPAAWKFGEKVPQGVKTYPVEPKLVEKLNFDPGYTFIRVGGDILALERDTGRIADAVLNLGKV